MTRSIRLLIIDSVDGGVLSPLSIENAVVDLDDNGDDESVPKNAVDLIDHGDMESLSENVCDLNNAGLTGVVGSKLTFLSCLVPLSRRLPPLIS